MYYWKSVVNECVMGEGIEMFDRLQRKQNINLKGVSRIEDQTVNRE